MSVWDNVGKDVDKIEGSTKTDSSNSVWDNVGKDVDNPSHKPNILDALSPSTMEKLRQFPEVLKKVDVSTFKDPEKLANYLNSIFIQEAKAVGGGFLDFATGIPRALGTLAGKLGYKGATGGDKTVVESMADPNTSILRPISEKGQKVLQEGIDENNTGKKILGGLGIAAGTFDSPGSVVKLADRAIGTGLKVAGGTGKVLKSAEKVLKPVTQAVVGGTTAIKTGNPWTGMGAGYGAGKAYEKGAEAGLKLGKLDIDLAKKSMGKSAMTDEEFLAYFRKLDDTQKTKLPRKLADALSATIDPATVIRTQRDSSSN